MIKAKILLRDTSFDPGTVSLLIKAFELACKNMHDKGQPDVVYEILARRIIKLAENGERDVNRLAEGAMGPIIGRR